MRQENGDYVHKMTSRDHLTIILEINPIGIKIERSGRGPEDCLKREIESMNSSRDRQRGQGGGSWTSSRNWTLEQESRRNGPNRLDRGGRTKIIRRVRRKVLASKKERGSEMV